MQDYSSLDEILKQRDSLFKAIPRPRLVEFAEYIEQEKRENPKELVQLICEAVLSPEAIEENPFAFAFRFIGAEWHRPTLKRFAELLHAVVTGRGRSPIDGYVSFLDVMVGWPGGTEELEYELQKVMLLDSSAPKFSARDIEAIPFKLIQAYAGLAGSALQSVTTYVHEGLPLYRRSPQGGFEMLSDIDALYHYIAKTGEFGESSARYSIPDWTEEVFFREADFEVHKLYFWGSEDLSLEAVAARRKALRNALEVSDSLVSATAPAADRHEHRTKLLVLVRAVIDRYYGEQFDEANPNTYTPQTVVVEWLMETNPGMSKRAAEAVDIVTRPDSIRGR